mmetsp:Transcript_11085/g.46079  ORF Transcript_11085/g.46079 Transcript_11085/m.46079 type:complete len:236 (+) Transcript_11085:2441-3148(+)|eukprot:PRCOL_00005943-RA
MASWTIEPPPRRSKLATGEAGGGALPVRTSETHPISVSWVLGSRAEAPPPSSEAAACAGSGSGGSLALCYCPGKRLVRDGVEWRRDMRADAQRLRKDHGLGALVCLVSDFELRALGVDTRAYAAELAAAGIESVRFPIVEMAAPDSVAETRALLERVLEMMEHGTDVALHCRGGVGRAGTLAACARLMRGADSGSGAAIAAVRRLRCKRAVESRRQEQFVAAFLRAMIACEQRAC